LQRESEFAPLAILRPAEGIVTGPNGIARRMALWFRAYGRTMTPGVISASLIGDDADGNLFARLGVPKTRRLVDRRGHHAIAIGAERRGLHRILMAF
jgi:hypothetical protein